MFSSFFRSKPTDPSSPPPALPPTTTPAAPEEQEEEAAGQPQAKTQTQTQTQTQNRNHDQDPPKLWTPQTNRKLFFGGLLFFSLSVLATRRALRRRHQACVPPFYTSSLYHKPKVNGAGEALEALNLATLNVVSFGMMGGGGVLWAMDINGLEDMRAYVRKGMLSSEEAGEPLTESDKELEKEVEDWIRKYLGKRVEGDKLRELEESSK
ncbi:hypothetical protein ARAM_005067 [Aspergillus rambellii]|uniref:Altered inheritance of mitochondria protein 11 n=1 Tax=Aspergillus rambellii TaxID=308745 RepID=A0A0F8VFV1_9EURO|nr:hypothetical protein ARAM_005067 [Aspergillus rambellii]